MTSVRLMAERIEVDPLRPLFHFTPPAQWINDPNAPIYFDGWYHMFYQHNPWDDHWGSMHWGHARSRDLVHWEHLPIALRPSWTEGEDGVWSGSATLGPDGRPIVFYTSVGPEHPPATALNNGLLFRWTTICCGGKNIRPIPF